MHVFPEPELPVKPDGSFISVPDGKSEVFTPNGFEVFEVRLKKPLAYSLSSVSGFYVEVTDVTPFASHIKWCGDRLLTY